MLCETASDIWLHLKLFFPACSVHRTQTQNTAATDLGGPGLFWHTCNSIGVGVHAVASVLCYGRQFLTLCVELVIVHCSSQCALLHSLNNATGTLQGCNAGSFIPYGVGPPQTFKGPQFSPGQMNTCQIWERRGHIITFCRGRGNILR